MDDNVTTRSVRKAIRAVLVAVVLAHGLIHLLGAAKGLGWAQVSQLKEPIGPAVGAAWLIAAVLVIAAGVLLGMGLRWWWVVGGVALTASQAVILTSWSDAHAGTVANLILLAAVVYGYASRGPRSYRAEYRRLVTTAFTWPLPAGLVAEADLDRLPSLVAAYVRKSGAVGQPRVANFRARFHGRIRAGSAKPWMSFTGEQVNTFSPQPSRLFFMDATLFGLPVDVLHVFRGGAATMRVKACSIVPIVDAAGPEMNQGETVTLFNDLCLLAPGALIDAPVVWHAIDERRVRGVYTYGINTVTAELAFNDEHDLIDFVSEDRSRTSADGKTFVAQRWSTPVHAYQPAGSRRIPAFAEAHWHAPEPEGEFSYFDLHVDRVEYNARGTQQVSRPPRGANQKAASTPAETLTATPS